MRVHHVIALTMIFGAFLNNASAKEPSQTTTATTKPKFPKFNYKTIVSSSEAYTMRGLDFVGQKNWKQAVVEYSKALELSNGKTSNEKSKQERNGALIMRAKCYGELHDTKKQLADLNKLVAESPDSQSYAVRGRYYYDQTLYPKALADYSKAIEIAPSKWDRPYDGRGRVYVRMKEFKKAIADLDQYCELNPKVPHAFLERANAYKQMNNLVASKKDTEVAKKLESELQHPVAHLR